SQYRILGGLVSALWGMSACRRSRERSASRTNLRRAPQPCETPFAIHGHLEIKSMFKRFTLFTCLALMLILALGIGGAAAQDQTYQQSPFLDARVAAGDLPPVEERLPANPRVIELPGSEIGTFGGDFRDPF